MQNLKPCYRMYFPGGGAPIGVIAGSSVFRLAFVLEVEQHPSVYSHAPPSYRPPQGARFPIDALCGHARSPAGRDFHDDVLGFVRRVGRRQR